MVDPRKFEQRKRKKLGRRTKRAAKQAANEVVDTRPVCPDCDTIYGTYGPSSVHRDGPCGCPEDVFEAMEAVLEARAEAFQKNRRAVCPQCRCIHTTDEQRTLFVEGRLIWNGCTRCAEANASVIEAEIDKRRAEWDGRKAVIDKATVEGRKAFMPPPVGKALP